MTLGPNGMTHGGTRNQAIPFCHGEVIVDRAVHQLEVRVDVPRQVPEGLPVQQADVDGPAAVARLEVEVPRPHRWWHRHVEMPGSASAGVSGPQAALRAQMAAAGMGSPCKLGDRLQVHQGSDVRQGRGRRHVG